MNNKAIQRKPLLLTIEHPQYQNSASRSSKYPVKHLQHALPCLLLQLAQEIDLHQSLHPTAIQGQNPGTGGSVACVLLPLHLHAHHLVHRGEGHEAVGALVDVVLHLAVKRSRLCPEHVVISPLLSCRR